MSRSKLYPRPAVSTKKKIVDNIHGIQYIYI